MAGKFVFGILNILVVLLAANSVCAEAKNVATVSGVPITDYEVSREIDTIMPYRVSFHGKMAQDKKDALKTEALDTLIERAYKVCYANQNKVQVDDQLIDDALTQLKARYKTEDAFAAAVAGEGVAALRASLSRQLVAEKVETLVVDSNVNVSDADVESFYEEKKHTFLMPRQYRASHIMIKVDPASNQDERHAFKAKADSLLVKAKAGEDFFNLAYYNSDDRTKYVGGDLGLFHEGQTAEPFEAALKEMQVGEISDLVKTRWGYHIIKLVEKNEPRQIPFLEVKGKVRAQLEKEQRNTFYQKLLATAKNSCKLVMLGE